MIRPCALALAACAPDQPPAVEAWATGDTLEIQADRPFLRVRWFDDAGSLREVRHLPVPLDHLSLRAAGPVQGRLQVDFRESVWSTDLDLAPRAAPAPLPPVPGQIKLEALVFPADRDGLPAPGVREGALLLSPAFWTATLRAVPFLGVRPADPEVPRAWHGVVLANAGAEPADVVVRLRVVDEAGQPDPAFRPRVRGAATDDVTALVRVPGGSQVRVALPVWVDEAAITDDLRRSWREVSVVGPGRDNALAQVRAPLAARRSGWIPGLTTTLTLAAGIIGLVGLGFGAAPALRRWPLLDQSYVAMFGALLVLIGLAGQVGGAAFLAVLGPFSVFLTAFLDDALRTAVLLALLQVCRRPGAVGLAVATAWLARSALFGGFTALDAVHAGAQVFWLEAWLRLTGSYAGRELGPVRAALALTGASLCATAGALAMQTTWLRLWLDPWFVGAWLVGPAGLYVLASVALAWGPTRALKVIS